MAEKTVRLEGTWIPYPALLSGLSEEHQTALEDATCAGYCGRYDEAKEVFKTRLPPSHTNLVLALRRADMLTVQGCEPERASLLNLTLETIGSNITEAERLLLEFMYADARYWHLGKTVALAGLTPTLRDALRTKTLKDLTDVEIRSLLLYYNVFYHLQKTSNYVKPEHQAIFRDDGNVGQELADLRSALQGQQRWRLLAQITHLELAYSPASGPARQKLVVLVSKFAEMFEASESPALKYMSVIIWKGMANQLRGTSLDAASKKMIARCIVTLDKLKDTATPSSNFAHWGVFAPAIALDLLKCDYINSREPDEQKIDRLLQLASTALNQHDYAKVDQAYIAAQPFAVNACRDTAQTAAREKLRKLQTDMIALHRDITKMAFFEAYALCDHLTCLRTKDRDFTTILKELEAFKDAHPEFEIPEAQAILYLHGWFACQKLDMKEKTAEYAKRRGEWAAKFRASAGGDSSPLPGVGLLAEQLPAEPEMVQLASTLTRVKVEDKAAVDVKEASKGEAKVDDKVALDSN